jgi:hypothetical protein
MNCVNSRTYSITTISLSLSLFARFLWTWGNRAEFYEPHIQFLLLLMTNGSCNSGDFGATDWAPPIFLCSDANASDQSGRLIHRPSAACTGKSHRYTADLDFFFQPQPILDASHISHELDITRYFQILGLVTQFGCLSLIIPMLQRFCWTCLVLSEDEPSATPILRCR